MSSRPISSLLLLIAAALPAAALDIDVRLTAGSAAMINEVDVGSGGSVDLEDESSGSGSLTGHVFLGDGLIGFMAGGGFRAAVHAGDQKVGGPFGSGEQADVTYESRGVLLEAGITIKPLPLWRIELRPQVTFGTGKIEVDVNGDNAEGDSGDYQSFGAVIGNYLRLGWFEIGIDLGYESFTGKSEIDDVETESKGDGFIAQLGIGVIF